MAHTDDEERKVARDTQTELEDKHFQDNILPARKILYSDLEIAHASLKNASRQLSRLGSNAVFDVEYESSSAGPLGEHIRESERLLAIARALLPTDASGNEVPSDVSREAVQGLLRGSHIPQ